MDISFKLTAAELGRDIENITPAIEAEINQAVKNVAHAAYGAIVNRVQSMNTNNRQNYLKALKLETLANNTYVISLNNEWANKLELGFDSYSIRDQLLKSTKTVQVGPRTGQPWVRKAKDGHRWAVVPFEHRLNTRGAKGGDLGTDIKQMWAENSKGEKQLLQKIFKDADGKPLAGRVAVINDAINDKFQNLVKYQYVYPSGKVSSLYMTYRAVSENGKDWTHTGFAGYHLFQEAEKYVREEFENMVKTILK